MEPESIFDLWRKVQTHPDYAGGALFVREDVAVAVLDLEDAPTDEELAVVTPAMLKAAEKIIESLIFNGVYTWADALRENIDRPA